MAFFSAFSVSRPRSEKTALRAFLLAKKGSGGETMAFFSASSVSRPRK